MKSKIIAKLFDIIDTHTNRNFGTKNKWGVQVGEGSFFGLPLKIEGGEYIRIGNNSSIGTKAWLAAYAEHGNEKYTPSLVIGNNVRIGNYACITSVNNISIGDGCLFSEYVYISDHTHGYDPSEGIAPMLQPLHSKGPVNIGENCFVGYRVSILPGVTLGRHCVVGSHAVVTASFPDYTMIAGVPAKAIKRFNLEKKSWEPLDA
jgi:lipopolysaccharide O-acetyltransferase